MSTNDRATRFAALHVKGRPLELFNAWDVGSAKAIAAAGASAIATSSWAVAAAQGYDDGEAIPREHIAALVARLVAAVDVPVTIDVEGGYAEDPPTVAAHVGALLDHGIVGINFEDRIVGGKGLHPIERQAERIAAIRRVARERGIALFINARCDVFFGIGLDAAEAEAEALRRARAYADAGASGLFLPGLVELGSITRIAASVPLPLNLMVTSGMPERGQLAAAGVARISHGPGPYLGAMAALQAAARAVYPPSAAAA